MRHIIAIAVIVWTGFAYGQLLPSSNFVGSNNDPFVIPTIVVSGVTAVDFKNISGRTQVDGTQVSGNCSFLIIGQSNAQNNIPSAYTVTNTGKVLNFNIYNGGVYQSVDPQLGTTGVLGNWAGRLGDLLVNASTCTKVTSATAAVGATSVSNWIADGSGTTGVAQKFVSSVKRLQSRFTPSAVLWVQGETDCINGTSQASYTASLNSLIASAGTLGWTSVPWFVDLESMQSGTTCSNVTNAQAAVVNHGGSPPVWQGGNMDSLTVGGGYRQADGTHLNDSGAAAWALLEQTALHAYGAPF